MPGGCGTGSHEHTAGSQICLMVVDIANDEGDDVRLVIFAAFVTCMSVFAWKGLTGTIVRLDDRRWMILSLAGATCCIAAGVWFRLQSGGPAFTTKAKPRGFDVIHKDTK